MYETLVTKISGYPICILDIEDLYEQAKPVGGVGNVRYHKGIDCWLFADIKDIPDYMERELRKGRILINAKFKPIVKGQDNES